VTITLTGELLQCVFGCLWLTGLCSFRIFRSVDLALAISWSRISNQWLASVARHRPSQHSLPLNTFSMHQHNSLNNGSPASERQTDVTTDESPNHTVSCIGIRWSSNSVRLREPLIQTATPSAGATQSRPALASLQSSYSTNDLPTMKSSNGLGTIITPPKTRPTTLP
jgi:hypothetical protein